MHAGECARVRACQPWTKWIHSRKRLRVLADGDDCDNTDNTEPFVFFVVACHCRQLHKSFDVRWHAPNMLCMLMCCDAARSTFECVFLFAETHTPPKRLCGVQFVVSTMRNLHARMAIIALHVARSSLDVIMRDRWLTLGSGVSHRCQRQLRVASFGALMMDQIF